MTEETLLFRLPKCIAEVCKGDGGLYSLSSVYQIAMLWGFAPESKLSNLPVLIKLGVATNFSLGKDS